MEEKILIGVLSASSALAGVVLAQTFSLLREHFDRRHKKAILFREKFETLSELVQEALAHSTRAGNSFSIKELSNCGINVPARRMLSLTLIYFPEFRDAAINFQNTYIAHYEILVNSFREGVNYDAGTQAAAHNREAYEASSQNLMFDRQALDDLIVKYAKKYTKA